MFFRANPGMSNLPCSCKDIYSRNALEELVHEDRCYDRYGRIGYTNILYGVKEESKEKPPENGFSRLYGQLKLHESKPAIFEFLEMSPWRPCTTLRDPHKACTVPSEKFDISENTSSENRIQRRSVSTLEASVGSKKKVKSDSSARPYSDSKLNESSRKPSTFIFHNSRNSRNLFEENYKFQHFKDFSKYIGEYTESVTLPRLQGYYREQNSRHGNARAMMSTRQQWVTHNALRSKRNDKDTREVPATNSELVSRDSVVSTSCDPAQDESYYCRFFPSFETCSFKVARCCVHAESKKERKAKTCGDDKGNEEELGMMNDRVQTPCERSSSTKWGKDDRRRANHKTSKILQKSKMKKLEIVTRQPNATSRNKKTSLTTTTRPSRWQQQTKLGRRFPSPRIMCRSPLVTKPAQFQAKVQSKRLATKTTANQAPNFVGSKMPVLEKEME